MALSKPIQWIIHKHFDAIGWHGTSHKPSSTATWSWWCATSKFLQHCCPCTYSNVILVVAIWRKSRSAISWHTYRGLPCSWFRGLLSESIAKAEAHCRDAELASETSGDLSQSAAQCKSEERESPFINLFQLWLMMKRLHSSTVSHRVGWSTSRLGDFMRFLLSQQKRMNPAAHLWIPLAAWAFHSHPFLCHVTGEVCRSDAQI